MIDRFEGFLKKQKCTGCTACTSVCPKEAIAMLRDEEGFLYPAVDESKCISCGLCRRVCPQLQPDSETEPAAYYAVKHRDDGVRADSTSGGFFSLLAQWVTEKGGVIYGAAFDSAHAVVHKRAAGDGWKAFRGAKYVQSDPQDTFRQVQDDLKAGSWVLYSGTPCQIDGLRKYLELRKVQRHRLLTCDLVCHGVPSPKTWQDYLAPVSADRKLGRICFRDKTLGGWHHSQLRILDDGGKPVVQEEQARGAFGAAYFNGYSLRPSCYACQYASFSRVGDFTIGDFWGIEKVMPEFDDDRGVSLVLVNSQRAGDIFQQLVETGKMTACPAKREGCRQPNLEGPSVCYGDRDAFWREYRRFGLEHAAKYAGLMPLSRVEGLWYRVYRKAVRILSRKR